MSQVNLHEIIRQQQEQLAAMQAQIQALLAAQGGAGVRGEVAGPNVGSHMEVVKLAIFNVLWQPLDTKSNDHTTSKSLKADI